MAFIKTCIHYAAFVYPNPGTTKARINLYCDDGYKLYLIFQDAGSDALPNNTYNASAKVGVGYATLDQYANYIDLIRNEKPIRVTFNPDASPPIYVVYASQETPGEGEM